MSDTIIVSFSTERQLDVLRRALVAQLLVLVLGPGCAVANCQPDQVSDPLTPEQSKAQVVDAAHEIVNTLGVQVADASFWHSSCNDDGVEPFQGEVGISYPLAPSFEQSDAEVADMVQRLRNIGWTGDPDLHTHSSALTKNHVVVMFDPQMVGTQYRRIDLLGECRDLTTTKGNAGVIEHLPLN